MSDRKRDPVNRMTRLLASRFVPPAFLLATMVALLGCQQIGLDGLLQAESPLNSRSQGTHGTPPSHRKPPLTEPKTAAVSPTPGQQSVKIAPGSQAVGAASHTEVLPSLAALPSTQPLPNPDLPSLTHLLGRLPDPVAELTNRPVVPPPATTDTVRVALLLPLTGPNATIGQAMLKAAQLAVFDFADRRLELLPIDTRGTRQGAGVAVATAIGDGAQMILGPLLASSVRAAAPAARAAHVPVLAFSSDRRVSGNGIFTLGFLPEDQVRRIVSYAVSRGITRFAALAPDNVYGATVFETLRAITRELGAEVTAAQFYDPSAEDFTTVVRGLADYDNRREALLEQRKELEEIDDEVSRQALKRLEMLQTIGDLPFDALLIADGGKRLQSLAALLPYYDIDPGKVRMLGTGQWDVPGLGTEPALMGGWYSAPNPKARKGFVDQYKGAYGSVPPRLATLAYDATALAAVLARGESGPDFSEATLTTNSGFSGRDGIFRFLPTGLAERGLAVMQVRHRDAKVIQPAPVKFYSAIN